MRKSSKRGAAKGPNAALGKPKARSPRAKTAAIAPPSHSVKARGQSTTAGSRSKAAATTAVSRQQTRSASAVSGHKLAPARAKSRPKIATTSAVLPHRTAIPAVAPVPIPTAPIEVRMETVDAERAGQRIDNFLASRLKGVPKSAVYRVLRTGQVRVNGKRAKPETKLEAGDVVRIPPMRIAEPGAPLAPSESLREVLTQRIVFEDAQFLVIDKPTGLAAHGGSGVSLGAIEALRAIRPQQELELVHRLDRDTSGLLLLAKKHSALRKLQTLIRESRVEKRYLALLMGLPARDQFEVNAALRKNQLRGGERMVEVNEQDGKASLSLFRVLKRFVDSALVEVEIITGRTHQIRVHARHAGHPLAGDPKYGDEAFNKLMKSRGLKRLFLHAHSVRFPWGDEGEHQFNAALGADLRAVVETLAGK